jgi:acylphosphatase
MSGGQRLIAIVAGYVQGVGFRAFVRRRALGLGLSGHARNLLDGSVEVVAEGPEEALRQLLDALRTGPLGSRVQSVSESFEPASGRFDGFAIG